MGMMLPDELVWIMDKLGFEWPDLDEDEIHRAATWTTNLHHRPKVLTRRRSIHHRLRHP